MLQQLSKNKYVISKEETFSTLIHQVHWWGIWEFISNLHVYIQEFLKLLISLSYNQFLYYIIATRWGNNDGRDKYSSSGPLKIWLGTVAAYVYISGALPT